MAQNSEILQKLNKAWWKYRVKGGLLMACDKVCLVCDVKEAMWKLNKMPGFCLSSPPPAAPPLGHSTASRGWMGQARARLESLRRAEQRSTAQALQTLLPPAWNGVDSVYAVKFLRTLFWITLPATPPPLWVLCAVLSECENFRGRGVGSLGYVLATSSTIVCNVSEQQLFFIQTSLYE